MLEKKEIYYWPAKQSRTLHIWLPDNYYETDERYPVMYMFDGHNLFFNKDATYGRSWGFREFFAKWPKNMIMIGLECSNDGYSRLSEYCPYNKLMFGQEIKGKGEETFQWIINDVKPWVDRAFRTYGHREATAIGGSSMGGLMSLYGVMAHNDVFSKAACLSCGVGHNASNLYKTMENSYINPDTRAYVSWGEFEMGGFDSTEARAARRFADELERKGASTFVYYQAEGGHCEKDWEKQIVIFMNYLWM